MGLRQQLSMLADNAINRLTAAVGRGAVWCVLFITLVQVAVVLLRYALGLGSIWLQESIIYGHATLFMLAAAWTLQVDRHVREIFSSTTMASSTTKPVATVSAMSDMLSRL